MKIRQLHINRFGHFTECPLVFSDGGLQVIYGPNEAGKTTLLEFLRGLLFDFPVRTPYDFGDGGGEMAGHATMELKDGRVVELRRRKKNKDKVAIKIDGQPTDLDDSGWARMLDHADRGLFESVFAFGLDQLSQGEASLKHDSLQSALFGGSLGGAVSPDKVTAELTKQADELFKKGGSKPKINALLSEIKRLTKEVKELSLRPEKYKQTRDAVSEAEKAAAAAHAEIDQLRTRHAKLEKQVRAWPKWWELQERLKTRGGLVAPLGIPLDARQQYQSVGKDLKVVGDDQSKLKLQIEQFRQRLAELKLDPAALERRAELLACGALRQSYVEAREQLPERRRLRDTQHRQIERELAELRPGWSHEDLRSFSIDLATQSEIERQSKERRARSTRATELTAKRDGDLENRGRMQAELDALGAPRDVAPLEAVLADAPDFVADRKQADGLRAELTKLERRLATQRRKLTPPLAADATAADDLPTPRVETIALFQARFAELRDQRRLAAAAVDQLQAEHGELTKQLAVALSGRAVPGLDERDAARRRRDTGWQLVRRKYVAGEQGDLPLAEWLADDQQASTVGRQEASLAEAYEQAVRGADLIADLIYDNANEVAQREGLRRQLATLAERLEQRRVGVAELEKLQAELQSQWRTLWQPCGFEPLDPDAMLAWLADHETVAATLDHRHTLLDDLKRLDQRIARFEQRVRAASGDGPTQRNADVATLLAAARQSVDDSKAAQRRTIELQKELRRLDDELRKSADKLRELDERETTAAAEWRAVLERLNLPAEWNCELAGDVIAKLSATRVRLDGLPAEEARIEAMNQRIDEFQRKVASLCQTLAPRLLGEPAEIAFDKLFEQMEQAAESQRTHEELSRKIADAQQQFDALGDRLAGLDSERARLFSLADATDEIGFLEVVSRAERVAELEGQIDQLRREIDLIRASDDREEFESSLTHAERSVLEAELRDLAERLELQVKSKSEADESVGAARRELAQLDGSARVPLLVDDLARKRSELAAEVDRYMPLVYARHLLSSAVSRFEKENQPAMIKTVSRLLGEMTGGKYVEFDRSGGSRPQVLIRRHDGQERTTDQLSTGTREQLYLAIRLAYVLHYCEKNQPLPIVIDDVLVNFDGARTRRTLETLAGVARTAQVLFFTCHSHVVTMAQEVAPDVRPIAIPATGT